jgi:hypothetical protein
MNPVARLQDAKTGNYIAIHKGEHNVKVQVAGEVSWRCGWEDRLGIVERTEIPQGATSMLVSRAEDSDWLEWQLLDESR